MHTWLKKRLSGVTDLVRVRGEYLEASRGLDETSISTLLSSGGFRGVSEVSIETPFA